MFIKIGDILPDENWRENIRDHGIEIRSQQGWLLMRVL